LTPAPAGGPPLARPAMLPAGARRWAEGLALPQVTPMTAAIGLFGALGLVQLWGWIYRHSYYIRGWEMDTLPGLVSAGQGANFSAGLTRVLPLALKALISAPLFLIALAILVGLVALPVLLLWLFGERVLADIVRPRARPIVVGGLFVAYTVLFLLFIIPGGLDLARWVTAQGLPGDRGLRMIGQLFGVGGILVKGGLLLSLVACGLLLWTAWRWLSWRISFYEVPLAWRLRYPALNSAAAYARTARAFARNAPLSGEERRRGLGALAGLFLLLTTLLAGAGRVQAYHDMCDGGDLPRLQLYHGEAPPNVINATLCQRMVVETVDAYWVYFPGQTTERIPGQLDSRKPNLKRIDKTDDLTAFRASGETNDCPSCGDGPNGDELFVVYPNEQRAAGTIYEHAGNLVTLDLEPGPGVIDSIRVDETTVITLDGSPATAEALEAGLQLVAFGALDPGQPNLIAAREVNVLSPQMPAPGEVLPGGDAQLRAIDSGSLLFEGQGWTSGHELVLRLVPPNAESPDAPITSDTPGTNLTRVVVDGQGGFAAPWPVDPQVPTGAGYKLAIIDELSGQVQVIDWLQQPLPTATPLPTVPTPAPTLELTPTPEGEAAGEPGEGTATAEPTEAPESEATNTPLPTPGNLPPAVSPPFQDCDPDEYEPDNARGQQTVLYPTVSGDLDTQTHNFCPKGDIDLYMFQVKAGRHYRVRTLNLAPGVDTVMAVGDLSPGTGCQPWHPSFGCWSDDRNANSLDSEIIFEAVANDLVIVTVDNRGLRNGSEASYDIGVEQYEPGAEATGTVTATPTGTATRLPLRDIYDNFASNNTCRTASEDALSPCGTLKATLGSASDEDYYITVELQPYTAADGSPGVYEFELQPPDGLDYDMDVGVSTGTGSRRICNRSLFTGQRDGDRSETFQVQINEPTFFYVRVYPRPGSSDYDPGAYYFLTLCQAPGKEPGPSATPTATPPPSATPRPPMAPTYTPVPVPSETPTAPARALPPSDTPTPGTP
ncbi:MAG: hypothetical protein KDH92_00780, partial [Chloroflexi bacterium]|nr:hypothetical protein [Chloroflexota bacterium]